MSTFWLISQKTKPKKNEHVLIDFATVYKHFSITLTTSSSNNNSSSSSCSV